MPPNDADPTPTPRPAPPSPSTNPSPQPPRQISLWALASLFCGAGFGCPPLALLAPLLGIAGLSQVKHHPHRYRGRNLAIAGIILGFVGIALWFVGLRWADRNIRSPILEGPEPAMHAAFSGDFDAFRSFFNGPAANASDAEIARFVQELSRRYGSFEDMSLGTIQTRDVQTEDIQPAEIVRPYLMRFTGGAAEADAHFIAFQPGSFLDFVGKWRWIIVRDPALGDFSFPEDALAEYQRPAAVDPVDAPADPAADPPSPIPSNGDADDQPDAADETPQP